MQRYKCRTVYLAGVMKASAPEAKTTSAAAAAQAFMIGTSQESAGSLRGLCSSII
jgi:hypothetical protein